MEIQLQHLPHQKDCLKAICKVFEGVDIQYNNPLHQNPLINLNDNQITENIEEIWNGEVEDLNSISYGKRRKVNDGILGIDAKLETGTGKTYVYTRLMYELHQKYGFNKFILFVPSTPIKEGTTKFIESDYAKKHFADIYPNTKLDLNVLNAQKSKRKGRKMFPASIADFARGSRLEKNRVNALLMSDSMLLSKATMGRNDYDQTLLGAFTQPYDTLEETRPIVIIDEPHRFKRENKAYECIVEKLNPQCIIRFGATFPELPRSNDKDYNNLIFELDAIEAFNEGLVKGVSVQSLESIDSDESKIKLMEITDKSKTCIFRNEKTKKTYPLSVGDYLSVVDENFSGITIESIGKTEEISIKRGVTLSNGQIMTIGDVVFSSIYGATYQELMMKQAIDNHFVIEKENFFRGQRIKTLSLFFIDSIFSYRGVENDGHLKLKFEELLTKKLKNEINTIDSFENKSEKVLEYQSFLAESLRDIKRTNGGYFAEDNSKADEDIKKEINKILKDKEALLTFKDEYSNWNTLRFIFSKWTLREGWDNPNVFQITKLRSSGSEISKLQEVGRGLRLPVDDQGNRISTEQFYLTYLVDFSEKDFAESLVEQINEDTNDIVSVRSMLSKIAKDRGMEEHILFAELLIGGYVDKDMNINPEKRKELMQQYPEFIKGLKPGKIINESKEKRSTINIRPERFNEIKELWSKINQKYYLKLEELSQEELIFYVKNILDQDLYVKQNVYVNEKRTEAGVNKVEIKEKIVGYHSLEGIIPYNEFLKRIHSSTGLPLKVIHEALIKKNSEEALPLDYFNKATLQKFILAFQEWLEVAFTKRFTYQKLGIDSKETSLTDEEGNVKKSIVQGAVGLIKDDSLSVPNKFLFDSFIYDSPKEKETIQKSDIDEVVVFGKIPRKSIQVPLYYGGTTSPDFMYVLKKVNGDFLVNFVVETKDIKKKSSLRDEELMRIESAKVFFNVMQADGLNVEFEKQMKNDDIVAMIKNLLTD